MKTKYEKPMARSFAETLLNAEGRCTFGSVASGLGAHCNPGATASGTGCNNGDLPSDISCISGGNPAGFGCQTGDVGLIMCFSGIGLGS